MFPDFSLCHLKKTLKLLCFASDRFNMAHPLPESRNNLLFVLPVVMFMFSGAIPFELFVQALQHNCHQKNQIWDGAVPCN